MSRDHRVDLRRFDLNQRKPEPTSEYREVCWRETKGDSIAQNGWLVDKSPYGLVMLTECDTTPSPGTRIAVSINDSLCSGFQPVVVTRTEQLSCLVDLVTAQNVSSESSNEQRIV